MKNNPIFLLAGMIGAPRSSVQRGKHSRRIAIGGLLSLVCALLLFACQSLTTPAGSTVTVRRVVSGQTIEVLGLAQQTNVASQVRLIGVDAPDLGQHPWGTEAKQYLEEIIRNQSLRIELGQESQDGFQRYLAYVWLDKHLLNEMLVAKGYALAVSRSPNLKYTQRLTNAQDYARVMELGIWNPRNPLRQTPTEFRAQKP